MLPSGVPGSWLRSRCSGRCRSRAVHQARQKFLREELAVARVVAGLEDVDLETASSKIDRVRDGPMNEFAGGFCRSSEHLSAASESLTHGPWKLVASDPWRKSVGMPEFEARAALIGVRYLFRNRRAHRARVLLLLNSMSVDCAMGRGCSSCPSVSHPVQALFV